MRIMQIMPEFDLAGAERMCENLSLELQRQGHEVIVLSFFDLETAITNNLKTNGVRVEFLGKKPGKDFSLFLKIRKWVRIWGPDVIHTHRYTPAYVFPATVGLHVPIVHTVHNVAQKEVDPGQQKLHRMFVASGRMRLVALSRQVRDTICEVYGLDMFAVPIVCNGINTRAYAADAHSGRTSHETRFLNIGRNDVAKNQICLIDAFSRVVETNPSARLTIVGKGPLRAEVLLEVERLSLADRVKVEDPVSDVKPLYRDNDIFIMPSVYEGMPMTLIEAMSSGIPIVATRVGGIPDMLGEEDAVLCDPTIESLERAMLYSIQNYSECVGRARRAQAAVKRFDSEAMASGYVDLYQAAVNR